MAWKILLFLVLVFIVKKPAARSLDQHKPFLPIPNENLKKLAILVLLPITGDLPKTGEACLAASEIMLQEINRNQDILPNYHVTAVYEDEGEQAAYSSAAAISFKRQFDGVEDTSKLLATPSPLIVGPYYSSGCLALAKHVHFDDMVQLATSCMSPQATNNRRIYPNLYRTKISGELVAFPQLRFIRDIAGWRRFGILTNAGYSFDYSLAIFLSKVATNEEGFNVSYFDCVPEVKDSTIIELRDSGTRVVVVDTSQPHFAIQFLCETYKFGITGSKFAFILHTSAFFEANDDVLETDIKNCTRDIVYEQLKYTFWIGWSMTPSERVVRLMKEWPLGLSLQDFEETFLNYTNGTKPYDYSKRFTCADSIYQALLALDKSERKLQERNLSLADYLLNPHEVMLAVNESVSKSDFYSYRIGKFAYSGRLELDSDVQSVTQWFPLLGEKHLYDVTVTNSSAFYNNMSDYFVAELKKGNLVWLTKNGKPPNDSGSVFNKYEAISLQCFIILLVLCLILTLIEIVGFVWSLVKQSSSLEVRSHSRIGFFLGCMILNLSAAIFLSSAYFNVSSLVCKFQRSFWVIGLGLIDGFIVSRMISFRSRKLVPLTNTPDTHRKVSRCTLVPRFDAEKTEKQTRRAMILSVSLSVGYVIVWMFVDAPYASDEILSSLRVRAPGDSSAAYDIEINHVFLCKGMRDLLCMAIVGAVHVTLLCCAVFVSFTLKRHTYFTNAPPTDFYAIRLAIFNSITLIVGGALILLLLMPQQITQPLLLSIANMLMSGATFGVIFKPIIYKR